MCLYKPQKVNNSKGIIAYKVVSRSKKNETFFRALRTNVPYKVGMSYVSLINKTRDLEGTSIIQEAIHLFTNLETAREIVDLYIRFRIGRVRTGYLTIIKCYIPKNAIVFKGRDAFGDSTYATNMIRMLEVVEEHEIV